MIKLNDARLFQLYQGFADRRRATPSWTAKALATSRVPGPSSPRMI